MTAHDTCTPEEIVGAYGGVRGFYEYQDGSWYGILNFVGGEAGAGGSSSIVAAAKAPMPKYRVAVMRDGKKAWLPWMVACAIPVDSGIRLRELRAR